MAGAVVPVRLIGPALFIGLSLILVAAVWAIVAAAMRPRVMAHRLGPAAVPTRVGPDRPCAVYEIDLTRGRRYIGHGPDPHERIMQSHRRNKWWPQTLTAQHTLEPDRVDWFDSKEIANAEEIRRIRAAAPGTLVNRVLYKTGAAKR